MGGLWLRRERVRHTVRCQQLDTINMNWRVVRRAITPACARACVCVCLFVCVGVCVYLDHMLLVLSALQHGDPVIHQTRLAVRQGAGDEHLVQEKLAPARAVSKARSALSHTYTRTTHNTHNTHSTQHTHDVTHASHTTSYAPGALHVLESELAEALEHARDAEVVMGRVIQVIVAILPIGRVALHLARGLQRSGERGVR